MGSPGESENEPLSLREWLERRVPEIPGPFLPHLLPEESPPYQGLELLADRAEEAFGQALAQPGRNRDAAFCLLAGDALLTYACEAAAEDDHPGERLAYLLARFGGRFR